MIHTRRPSRRAPAVLRDLKAENDPSQARIFDFDCKDTTDAKLTALGHADLDTDRPTAPQPRFIQPGSIFWFKSEGQDNEQQKETPWVVVCKSPWSFSAR